MKKIVLSLIFCIGCILPMMAQWNVDPSANTLINTSNIGIDKLSIAVRSDNGIYMLCREKLEDCYAYYAQLVDKDGVKQWGDKGLLISNYAVDNGTTYYTTKFITVDNEDNVIIAVQDDRYTKGHFSYTVYKLSPEGNMLWGDEGIKIARFTDSPMLASLNMLVLDDNSILFSWTEESVDNSNYFPSYIERISSEGQFMWEAPICLGKEAVCLYTWLIDGAGDTFNIVYSMNDKYDLAFRNYDLSGNCLIDDVIIYDGGFDTTPIYTHVNVISDNNGGVYVGWRYIPEERGGTNFNTFVAQITSTGEYSLGRQTKGGVQLDDLASGETDLIITTDADNNVIACYQAAIGDDIGIVFQKLDNQGNRLWGEIGLQIDELMGFDTASCESLTPLNNGNILLTYTFTKSILDNKAIYALCINGTDGSLVWSTPTKIQASTNTPSRISTTPLLENNHCVVAWIENDFNDKVDMMMQPIYVDGSLASAEQVVIAPEQSPLTVFAENGAISVKVDVVEDGSMSLNIYSIDGRRLVNQTDNSIKADNYEYKYNVGHGVYVIELILNGQSYIKKCVC